MAGGSPRGSLGSDTARPVIDAGTSCLARSPLPGAVTCDLSTWDRSRSVLSAFELAYNKYMFQAIIDQTTDDFSEAVKAILPGLRIAAEILIATTAVGAALGSLAGGVGAGPGAAAGFAAGLEILDALGLGFLVVYISARIDQVNCRIAAATRSAWDSCNLPAQLDQAARQYADGVGLFFSLLMQAITAYAAKEGFEKAIEALNSSKYGSALAAWLERSKWSDNLQLWLDQIGDPKAAPLVKQRLKTTLDFLKDRRFGRDNLRFSEMEFSKEVNYDVSDKSPDH